MAGTESEEPLVSIVIPVYNGARYLAEAIDSALGQTYRAKEVVVVNDGSTDGGATEAVANAYGRKIRYFNKENGGVSTALNKGIEEAQGGLISWLSHDDAYPPDKVERQVAFLKGLGDRARRTIPYGGVEYMDERSVVFDTYRLPRVPPEGLYQALLCEAVFVSPVRRMRFGINGCTTLIPKEAFPETGMFDPALRTTQDYDMWFRLNRRYDFVQMDGALLRSRLHREQGCRTMSTIHAAEVGRLFDRALGHYRKGSDKWDLDLPQTALALRMSKHKKAAARKAMAMARAAEKDMTGTLYYGLARAWNPAFRVLYDLTDRTTAQ